MSTLLPGADITSGSSATNTHTRAKQSTSTHEAEGRKEGRKERRKKGE